MTIQQLKELLYHSHYPDLFEVDDETYMNVYKAVFAWAQEMKRDYIATGPNGGLMFKNVEIVKFGALARKRNNDQPNEA